MSSRRIVAHSYSFREVGHERWRLLKHKEFGIRVILDHFREEFLTK